VLFTKSDLAEATSVPPTSDPLGNKHGKDPDDAILGTVRALVSAKQLLEARSFALRLADHPATRDAGRIGAAIVASKNRLIDLAAAYLRLVPDEKALTLAPTEWYQVQFNMDPDAALKHFRDSAERHFPSATWVLVIKSSLRHGLPGPAAELCRLFLENPAHAYEECQADRANIQFIDDFLRARQEPDSSSRKGGQSDVTVGIWDSAQPDIAGPSADLGIHLESVLLLLRLRRVASLAPGKAGLARALQRIGGPDNELATRDEPRHQVRIVAVPRYAPREQDVPRLTWTVYHGRFGQKVLGARPPFPVASNIRPIFFGFELADLNSDPGMMTILRKCGPVGCADWATTYAMLSQGVEAFLSGPLANLATPLSSGYLNSAGVAGDTDMSGLVSSDPGRKNLVRAQQKSARLRSSPMSSNLETALEYLQTLETAEAVSTPHPETHAIRRALGLEVHYAPPGRSITTAAPADESPEAGRPPASVSIPLDAVLEKISSGADEAAVYETWSRATAALVAEAWRRYDRPPVVPPTGFDVESISSVLRENTVHAGKAEVRQAPATVHVAMACDANLFGQLAVAIGSLQRGTDRKLQIHLLCRGLGPDNFKFLASLFPEIAFDFIPCDSVDYGNVLSTGGHLTVSSIDRLLLPALLRGTPKVVYLDVDLLVLADVGKLFDIDLKSVPLAACSATADWSKSGYGHLGAVAQRLGPTRSEELKHLMLRIHRKDFLAFNSGVLVLNLEQMRSDNFCARFLGYLSYFDMTDQDVLYCYTGGNWRALHPTWNCIPSQVYVSRPLIVHWAGPAKPWQDLRMPYQGAWCELVQDLAAQAAACGLDAAPIGELAQAAI
jgi:lipopolysaccharide biosynthesis glycosyltransferase